MAIVAYLTAALLSYQFWLLALVTYFLYRKLTRKSYNLPPRPHSWPIIGNNYHVFKGDPVLYKWCQKVAREVGPVIRVSLGTFDAIVLNDFDTTQRVMQQKGNDFNGRMKSPIIELFSDGYSDLLMADADHPTFKPRRKLLATALRNFTVGRSYEERVSESLNKVFELLDPFSDKQEPFDPENYSKLLTYNLMASICFQKGYHMNDPEFVAIRDMFQEVNDAFGSGVTISDIIPFVRYLPFEFWDMKMARNGRDKLVNMINDEIRLSRKRIENSGETGDLTAFVLKTREEGQKEGLDEVTDVQVTQLISDVFGAGVDTTQMTLRWILVCLAAYQDIQEKVYQEILDKVDSDDDMVSAIDYKARMPYSEAVLLEATRYGTVAPLGLPHSTLCDAKIDDYEIPKDTLIMVNHWAINHDEKDFPEPDKFVPERFLDTDGNVGPRPRGYLPFGMGRRACPGETAARTTLWISYVTIVRRYKILPPEGVQLKPEYKDSGFEGSPKPFRIVLQRRV